MAGARGKFPYAPPASRLQGIPPRPPPPDTGVQRIFTVVTRASGADAPPAHTPERRRDGVPPKRACRSAGETPPRGGSPSRGGARAAERRLADGPPPEVMRRGPRGGTPSRRRSTPRGRAEGPARITQSDGARTGLPPQPTHPNGGGTAFRRSGPAGAQGRLRPAEAPRRAEGPARRNAVSPTVHPQRSRGGARAAERRLADGPPRFRSRSPSPPRPARRSRRPPAPAGTGAPARGRGG